MLEGVQRFAEQKCKVTDPDQDAGAPLEVSVQAASRPETEVHFDTKSNLVLYLFYMLRHKLCALQEEDMNKLYRFHSKQAYLYVYILYIYPFYPIAVNKLLQNQKKNIG